MKYSFFTLFTSAVIGVGFLFFSCTKLQTILVPFNIYVVDTFDLPRYTKTQILNSSIYNIKQPIILKGDIYEDDLTSTLESLGLTINDLDSAVIESIVIRLNDDTIKNDMSYFNYIEIEYFDRDFQDFSLYFDYFYIPFADLSRTQAFFTKKRELDHVKDVDVGVINLQYKFYIAGIDDNIGFAPKVSYKIETKIRGRAKALRSIANSSIF